MQATFSRQSSPNFSVINFSIYVHSDSLTIFNTLWSLVKYLYVGSVSAISNIYSKLVELCSLPRVLQYVVFFAWLVHVFCLLITRHQLFYVDLMCIYVLGGKWCYFVYGLRFFFTKISVCISVSQNCLFFYAAM